MAFDISIGRDSADKENFGDRGLVYIGKGYVKMGNYTSLSNKIWLDVARTHVILVAGKRGCLEGNTLVFTDKGHKKIRDFKETEDKILSFNKEKKEFEWENAKLLQYPIKDEKLIKIEFINGKEIILTKEHPLLTTTGNSVLSLLWLKAEELKEKDSVLSIGKSLDDLTPLQIKKMSEISNIEHVYDLTVNKNHSFIANGVISHNSGKSYTLGVIAEELANLPKETSQNIASLIFDTMGIFWTMKYKNEKDKPLLDSWNLETKSLPAKIFVPFGKAGEYEKKLIPFDATFALKPSELEAEDWLTLFKLEMTSLPATLITRILSHLKKISYTFTIADIQNEMKKDSESSRETKEIVSGLFTAADEWGIFSRTREGTEISDLITPGLTTILDTSIYSSIGAYNIRALVISLVCRKLHLTNGLKKKRRA